MTAARNGLWDALGTLSGMMAAALGSLLIVGRLSPAQYGTFSYYAWGGTTLLVLVTAAFPSALTKVSSELRGEGEEAVAHVLTRLVVAGVSVLSSALAAGIILWALHGSAAERPSLLIIAAFLVPAALASTLAASLRGDERFRPVSLIDAVTSAIQVGLIVVAYVGRAGPTGFLAAVLVPSVLQLPGLLFYRRRQQGGTHGMRLWPRRVGAALARRYLRYAAPATLTLLFEVIIWQRSEIFFLERLSGSTEVGFYSFAFTVYAVFLGLGRALVNGFFPAVSKDFGADDWPAIRQKMQQGVSLGMLYAVPVSFGGMLMGKELITLVYGPKMLPSAVVAQVLFAGLILGVPGVAYSLMVSAVRGVWLQVRLGAALSVVSLALDAILISHLGALGAAIANTSVVGAYTILLGAIAWRRYQVAVDWQVVVTVVIVSLVTTLVLPGALQVWLPGLFGLATSIAAAGCLYAVCVWRLGYARRFYWAASP